MGEGHNFSRLLIDWYHRERRYLPWREDPTPYHVWLSEIMLQQTRVEAVKDYYNRFLLSLPDIEALANAPEDVVLKLWEGLGYYSRARNLQKAAKRILSDYSGTMPGTARELVKLPGIGPYTAAAIASIAFGQPVISVDGNLLRVFSRLTCYEGDIKEQDAKSRAEEFYLQRLLEADESEKETPAGDFNQALMDIGATICLPNGEPLCGRCPFAKGVCMAHALGKETDFPVLTKKPKRRIEERTVLILEVQDKVVLHKRPDRGLLAGLYEFPGAEGHLTAEEVLSFLQLPEDGSIRAGELCLLPAAKHIFTHIEWQMIGYRVSLSGEDASLSRWMKDRDWFPACLSELEASYSIPSAFEAYRRCLTGQN